MNFDELLKRLERCRRNFMRQLQRALLDLYCGGMVFLREDLARFGEQVYRGSLL